MALLGTALIAAVGVTTPTDASTPSSFVPFETEILPLWLERFHVAGGAPHEYSFFPDPHNSQPTIYGSADVLHVLYGVNQLNLSTAERAAWVSHVNSFQNSSGFFTLEPHEKGGWEPWHVTGDASAALHILGAAPAQRNVLYNQIAAEPALWDSTFRPLLEPQPFPNAVGCDHFHMCAHKLVAIPTMLTMEDPVNNPKRYAPFFTWLFEQLDKNASPHNGYFGCQHSSSAYPNSSSSTKQTVEASRGIGDRAGEGYLYSCMGGSFAVHTLMRFFRHPWPYNQTVQSVTLLLQNKTGKDAGHWASTGGYDDVDGLFQAARPLMTVDGVPLVPRGSGEGRWGAVEAACRGFLRSAVVEMNNASWVMKKFGDNTHGLMAMVGAVGECQLHFPELVHTVRPWRSVMDKAAFI